MSQHLCISGSSARSMSPDPYISIHMYLRILCKIHVSGFMSQRPYVSQEPLLDPCLRIHVSASLYLRSFCKIHVSDSCLSILIIRFCGRARAKRKFWLPETRFVWPCAGKTIRPRSAGAFRIGETQILTSGDAFCVALRRENSPTERFAQAKRKFWPAETHFLWPCASETQI